MPTGQKVIEKATSCAVKASTEAEAVAINNLMHSKLLEIHSRALSCHSECLGMNAENSWAVCNDNAPPYTSKHYRDVMEKWGMVDEEGEPII